MKNTQFRTVIYFSRGIYYFEEARGETGAKLVSKFNYKFCSLKCVLGLVVFVYARVSAIFHNFQKEMSRKKGPEGSLCLCPSLYLGKHKGPS